MAQQRSREADGLNEKQYLIGRSRNGRGFRRAGVQFDGTYQAIPLADLKPEQIAAIEKEPMLESRIVGEDEAHRLAEMKAAVIDPSVSKAELAQHVIYLQRRLDEQAERIRELELKLTGDRPPKRTSDLPPAGNPPGVPATR